MKELPYFKFFTGEWLKGDITVCSMSAQGLFINLCVFYWGKENGLNLTFVQRKFNTCSTELEELIEMEIIGIEDGKIIINFLDEQFSEFEELRKQKSRAGKASAKKRKDNTRSTPVQQAMNNKEKIREDKEEDKINIEFEDFWNLYDKKAGDKTKIEKKWNNLSDSNRDLIIKYIPRYIKSTPDKKFRKNPETFLNNKSWNDEIIEQVDSKKIEPSGRKETHEIREDYGVVSETAMTLEEYRAQKGK